MKRLTLVRHGQAESKSPGQSDFERALTHAGEKDTKHLAHRLAKHEWIPERILASPARRAHQTAHILLRELDLPSKAMAHDERIYLAAPHTLLAVIRASDAQIGHLMLVGHNPGISELAQRLAADIELAELGTAEACILSFKIESWSQLEPGEAHKVRSL